MVINGKEVRMDVECKTISINKIVGKIYLGKDNLSYQSNDLIFDNSQTVACQANFEPELISACILDEYDDIIDGRNINLIWSQDISLVVGTFSKGVLGFAL